MYRCPRCKSLSIPLINSWSIAEVVDCSKCDAKLRRKGVTWQATLKIFYPWIASVGCIAFFEYSGMRLPMWAGFGLIFLAACVHILFLAERAEFVEIENAEKRADLNFKEGQLGK